MTPPALLVLATLLGENPQLYLSVERAGPALVAHLSMRGAEDVELSLYQLPAEPGQLLAAGRPDRSPAVPPSRPPSPIADLRAGRQAALRSAAGLRAGLSSAAGGLIKSWFGLEAPVASALPPPARAEVETAGLLVRAWRLDAPEPGWNYADVDLNPLPAGLYSLVMRAEGGRAAATVVVADLTALCVRTSGSLSLLAQERESGLPRAGAEIFVERQGQAVLLGRTAADGVFTTRAPIPGSLVIRQGSELALLAVPQIVRVGETDMIGAVFPDRRIAQPGDALGVWTLFRSVAGDGRVALPDSAHGELQLVDREGRSILRQPLTLSALGTATSELELPLGLAPGDYTVAVLAGDERRAADLTLVEPGLAQLSVGCESTAVGGDPVARCVVRDALGRPESGAAVHWRLEHPLQGPSEEAGAGAAITGEGGRVDVRVQPRPGGQWLRAEATDALGRTAATALALADPNPIHVAFRSERRLLRPGRTAVLSLDASSAGEPFRGRVHLTATSVRSGSSGEVQATPLFERWLETDARGHASLSLTASSPGTIELSALTEPPGGSAHATLFVSESGGDIPATPERLTLIPEAGEHHRGEETHLLVLAPFESGTVLLAFEPPLLPTQALAVHGYSGVVRLTLPAGSGPLAAVAAAFRGGQVITDRLSLLAPRSSQLAVRAVLDHAARPGARAAIAVDTADEAGHPLASQVTLLGGDAEPPPSLADLLLRGQSNVAIAGAQPPPDSLPPPSSFEPRMTIPFGPPRAEVASFAQSGFLQTLSAPDTGRLAFAPTGLAGTTTLTVVAVAGPDEIGQTRLTLPAPSAGPMPSAHPLPLAFERAGDQPLDRHGVRPWPPTSPATGPLAQAIADLLGAVPVVGASPDLGCAAVRAVSALSPSRSAARGPLARLAQLENLEGGFGDAPGELRRDLAALRGLRALGSLAESELVTRTRAQIGNLADDMEADDPERAVALALVSSSTAREASPKLSSDELRTASAQELAPWLAAHPLSRAQRQLAGARVLQLIATADVLDLAELAVAAEKLGLRAGSPSGAPNVARQISRLRPGAWTQALLDADEEPPDPARLPVQGPVRVDDELEVQLTAPVAGRGNYCLRDFPPAGGIPEGASGAEASVVLCGEPSAGILRLSYRLRMNTPGRFQMPAPAFGMERPADGLDPEWLEVTP